ncbi:hypothetical protein BOO86_16015 [Mycobacterium sp. CBMA 234]|uniref:TetR/AcrR family transcriptional regulator n=1 Tax=Mycolicibacterium sp. CBMA 234 TaxID=1918495 RepID=UPI001390BE0D|nr:TetR family transcriptional regulator [Mycolicibacterium sp. CBMA 234]MUL65983.1 hypothetical protein [Mycolicibacterium sp. CBMA 234]
MESAPTVRDRLISAADAALRKNGVDSMTVEAVAQTAGISRATAFRQLGKREDMIVAVGVQRAADYARRCAVEMAGAATASEKLHVAFQFLVRELPEDPVMRAVVTVRTAADLTIDVHDLLAETFGPVVDTGRVSGEIRADVPAEQVILWIVEQLYLAIQQPDRDPVAVRDRLRLFVFPALAPTAVASASSASVRAHVDGLAAALQDAERAVSALREELADEISANARTGPAERESPPARIG